MLGHSGGISRVRFLEASSRRKIVRVWAHYFIGEAEDFGRFAARVPGPGLWPGPRRQARWAGRGLRGQRRAAGASRAVGCEEPLRPEGSARTMRGAPVLTRRLLTSSRLTAHLARARRPGRGAGGRGSEIRRGPQRSATGAAARGSRRAVGLASEGRGESCRPTTARPPG